MTKGKEVLKTMIKNKIEFEQHQKRNLEAKMQAVALEFSDTVQTIIVLHQELEKLSPRTIGAEDTCVSSRNMESLSPKKY